MTRVWVAAIVLCAGLFLPQRLRIRFPDEPLLKMNDLTFLGTGKVQTSGRFPNQAEYGGRALAYDAAGDSGAGSLWASGSDVPHKASIAEYCGLDAFLAAMDPADSTLAAMPTLNFCSGQGYAILDAADALITGGDGIRVGGIYPANATHLWLNTFGNYGNPSSNAVIINKDLTPPTIVSGPFTVLPSATKDNCAGNCSRGWVGGSINDVPSAWQSALGGDVVVSAYGSSVPSSQSSGPNLTSFYKADFGVKNPAPGRRLLGYPNASGYVHQTLGDYDGTNGAAQLWCGGESYGPAAVTIVPGYRSVWYWGAHGNCAYFAYGEVAQALDGGGHVSPAVPYTGFGAINGADASTNSAGTRVTVPNANLTGLDTAGGNSNWWIWLKEQDHPIKTHRARTYAAATKIIAGGNSGRANAYVDVPNNWGAGGTTFDGNLTNQHYAITPRASVYDPTLQELSTGGFLWPLAYNVWAYDLNVLATATNYWDPIPAMLSLPVTLPYTYNPSGKRGLTQPRYGLLGGTYDPDRHNLYIVQAWAEDVNLYERWLILAWHVADPAPSPWPFPLAFAALAFAFWPAPRRASTGCAWPRAYDCADASSKG